MLSTRKLLLCLLLGLVFWAVAALRIRLLPASFHGVSGDIEFFTTIPTALLCVWLIAKLCATSPEQFPTACMIVLAIPMAVDAFVLRWFSGVYAPDPTVCRLGAAWLLWGYAVSAAGAAWLMHRRARGRKIVAPLPGTGL